MVECVVISVRSCQCFYSVEKEKNENNMQATMSWLFGPTFQRAEGLTYDDELKAFLHSGFSFLSAGKKLNNNRAENKRRLIITTKDLLAKMYKAFPGRPHGRAFNVGGKTPNYKAYGVDYSFRSVSRMLTKRKLNDFSLLSNSVVRLFPQSKKCCYQRHKGLVN